MQQCLKQYSSFPCQTHVCVMMCWMCATIQCHVEV